MLLIEFLEDIMFHEMQLLHPGGICDLDKKDSLFYVAGTCLGGDTGTDGLKPYVTQSSILRFYRKMIFLERLVKDVVNPLQFG